MNELLTTHEFTNHDAALAHAEQGVANLASVRNNRWYPRFHIASNGGWINDPNGLCYYGGRWHVFYQLHPYGTQWGPMHWGHVSSEDMLHWQREPIAFAPSLEEERNGVFSGSAIVDEHGDVRFFYTGHRWANGTDNTGGEWQVQMLATPEDPRDIHLQRLTKRGVVVDCPREQVHWHFRDPKVWNTDGTWYMTFGVSSADQRGQMWLYTSTDLEHWSFDRVLFEHPDPDVFMLECPDFFPVTAPDGSQKWVIGFSAMGAKANGFMNRNTNNAGYMIGTWKPGESFQPETEFRLWDWGHNFYAPQSFTAPDGRQIMYGWMSPFVQPIPMEDDGWCGQLTLAREITLGKDGDLHTTPMRELEGLRGSTKDFGNITLGVNEELLIADNATATELEIDLDLTQSTAERISLHVHETQDGSFTNVAFDAQMGRIVLDRVANTRGDKGYRAAPLDTAELQSSHLHLRVFVDRGSVEVYVNDGHQVLSSYSLPSSGPRAIRLIAESGTATINRLVRHELKSIGLE